MLASEESPWTEPLLPFEKALRNERELVKGAVEHVPTSRAKASQIERCAAMGIRCGVNAIDCTNCAEAHGISIPRRRCSRVLRPY